MEAKIVKAKCSVPSRSHVAEASTSETRDPWKKSSAKDIFGSDSDDDQCAPKAGKKPTTAICSYFTKRVPHGVMRQTNVEKEGSHYIELKVYKCDEINHIQPMNRWRHAIITVKNKSDVGTEAWEHQQNKNKLGYNL